MAIYRRKRVGKSKRRIRKARKKPQGAPYTRKGNLLSRPITAAVVRCVESTVDLQTVMDATGFYIFSPTFRPVTFPEWSSWSTLFRQFKMCGVRTEFIVTRNLVDGHHTTATGQNLNTNIEMRYYPRSALQATPANMLEVCNIRQSKSCFLYSNRERPQKVYCPLYVRQVIFPDNGDIQNNTTGPLVRPKFMGCVNGENVLHTNLVYAFQNTTYTAPPAGSVLKLRHYIYMTFKGQSQ